MTNFYQLRLLVSGYFLLFATGAFGRNALLQGNPSVPTPPAASVPRMVHIRLTLRKRVVDSTEVGAAPYEIVVDSSRVTHTPTDSIGRFTLPVYNTDTPTGLARQVLNIWRGFAAKATSAQRSVIANSPAWNLLLLSNPGKLSEAETKAQNDFFGFVTQEVKKQAQQKNIELGAMPVTSNVQSADTVTFDPFGAGTVAPRRAHYKQSIWVEAVNINPFKYVVELNSTPFSYVYQDPAAPISGGTITSNTSKTTSGMPVIGKTVTVPITSLDPQGDLTDIKGKLIKYRKLLDALRARYQLDNWPLDNGHLAQLANGVFGGKQVTVTEFVDFRRDQLTTINGLVKQGFTAAEEEQSRLTMELGGSDATRQAAVTKEAETLAQVLLTADKPWPTRQQRQVVADGDEMESKLTLTKRADFQALPGHEPGTLLEWKAIMQVTHRFRITTSAGVFVTGLRDYTFALLEDSTKVRHRVDATSITDTTTRGGYYKRAKRIVRSNTEEKVSIGFSGLTHFHYRLTPSFDVAASLGLGVQTSGLQLLTGLTILTGGEKQRLCLTGGLIGGRVSRLSGGYAEQQIVDKSMSVAPTQIVNKLSWFFALTYNIAATRQ